MAVADSAPAEAPAAQMTEEPQEITPAGTPVAAPVAFPSSDSRAASSTEVHRPSMISFGVSESPAKAGTAEGDEDKSKSRRRISSQNLSKFAKRMSLGRRGSSSVSTLDQVTTPPAKDTPSPQTSVDESLDKKGKKKEEKRERPRRMPTLSFSRPKSPAPSS